MKAAFSWIVCCTAFAGLVSASGCGTAKSFYNNVLDPSPKVITDAGPDKSGLKKRVLLLPLMNQAGLSGKRLEQVSSLFNSLLEKDSHLLLEKAADPLPSTVKMRSPRYGIVMDTDAAKKAEEMGVNALITVVLNPYELRVKRTGFWPIQRVRREVEISVAVNALDLINGTLFLSNLEIEKLEYKIEELEDEEEMPKKIEMPEIDDKTFTRVFSRLMERQGSAIRSALSGNPWTGRILSAEQNKVIISAGKKVGLSGDRVFEVFNRGEQVKAASGASIYLLGPKVGEVKTVQTMEEFAIAQPLSDAPFKAGQIIRVKK